MSLYWYMLLSSISIVLLLQASCCRAAHPVALTDKTFDNVREAFEYPSMLILTHAGKVDEGRNQRVFDEFRRLSNDDLLQDVMLVTIDATGNRMLATRMGVPLNELPCLIYLYNDHIFQYQGKPTSAELMRSYALQGFHNQGTGVPMLDSSYWLLIKTTYLDWLFNGSGESVNINVEALVVSGFIVGILVCAIVAVAVSICLKEEEVTKVTEMSKTKKKQ